MSQRTFVDSQTLSPEIQVARLEMILEVSRSLHATMDLPNLIRLVTETACQLTDGHLAAVLLLRAKAGAYVLEAFTVNERHDIERTILPLENSIANWVIQNGESLVVDDLVEAERGFGEVELLIQREVQTILGTPLKLNQKTIGAVEVFNKRGGLGFSSDDIHLLNTLAAQAAVALENARRFEQNDEVAQVVDELRSPVISIIDSSRSLLAQAQLNSHPMRQELEVVNQEALRLSQIVNNFLDLTKLETGRLGLNKRPVDFKALLPQVVDYFQPQALAKNIELHVHVEDNLPEILGDADRLRQVMVILIDNAIKYNRVNGQVRINLVQTPVRLQLAVADTGIGLGSEELSLVFNKFYRARHTAASPNGTGLSLSIARKIIKAHEGDIWVESELGQGSCFTFSLPYRV